MGDNVARPQRQQFAVQVQPFLMLRLSDNIPVEAGSLKRSDVVGIRDARKRGRVAKPGETSELVSSASRDRGRQIFLEVAEKQKGRSCSKFFPHKEEWRLRAQKKDRSCRTNGERISDGENSLPERSVPNLIVILKE